MPRAFAREGAAAPLTNGLLENASAAVDTLWKQRGYHPTKPEVTKARLGYALDTYEAGAYLVTGAMHKPLISPFEAKYVGKRIKNIIGKSGSIGKELVKLWKRGKVTAPQVTELLQAKASLNFEPPPRDAPTPAPAPAPAPIPPQPTLPPPTPPPLSAPTPPPLPPPSAPLQLGPPAPCVDYLNTPADQPSAPLWSTARHASIPGYRGRPGGDNEERYWNPAMPPCVPSDHRPAQHLFNSRDAAEAARSRLAWLLSGGAIRTTVR